MHTAATALPATVAGRAAATELTVLAPDGTPLARRQVTVEQTRHAFGFGNTGFDFIELANGETATLPREFGGAALEQAQHLADLWLDVLNLATLPFYWRAFEPERGRPDTRRLRRTAEWFAERGVTVRLGRGRAGARRRGDHGDHGDHGDDGLTAGPGLG